MLDMAAFTFLVLVSVASSSPHSSKGDAGETNSLPIGNAYPIPGSAAMGWRDVQRLNKKCWICSKQLTL
jgi:hypothetical protein